MRPGVTAGNDERYTCLLWRADGREPSVAHYLPSTEAKTEAEAVSLLKASGADRAFPIPQIFVQPRGVALALPALVLTRVFAVVARMSIRLVAADCTVGLITHSSTASASMTSASGIARALRSSSRIKLSTDSERTIVVGRSSASLRLSYRIAPVVALFLAVTEGILSSPASSCSRLRSKPLLVT